MYQHCFASLKKIRERALRQSGRSGITFRGLPFTVVADLQAHQPLATLYYINAVSILDDGLKIYMRANFSAAECRKQDTLGKRLVFLMLHGITSDPVLLAGLKDSRNEFSHEIGRYGTWEELWLVLDHVQAEIHHLESL